MRRFGIILLLCFFLFLAAGAVPQAVDGGDPQFRPQRNQDDLELRQERERQKRLNKDRQARIKKDTDKLLTLATQLKEYVDKTNENVLSVDVITKADEIEKLAHSIREKMKEDYTPPAMH